MIRRICAVCLLATFGCLSILARNRALLVGIGGYDKSATGGSAIHGDNDVKLLESKLKTRGFSVSKLTDRQATKGKVEKALSELLESTNSGDVVYLHFSGHGQLIEDLNHDEKGAFDQSFVCYDACYSPRYVVAGKSYRGQNHLIDDELFPYLNGLKRKVGKNGTVTVVFDSCYSGGADRSPASETPEPESEVEWSSTVRGTDDEFKLNGTSEAYLRSIGKPGEYSPAGGKLTVISACGSDERNYECKQKHSGRIYGSLSFCIARLLDRNVPVSQLGEHFTSGKFRNLKVFRSTQHPVAEIHH